MHLVSNFMAEGQVELEGDALGSGDGGDAARLGAADHPRDAGRVAIARLVEELRQLRALAAARRAAQDEHVVLLEGLHDGLLLGKDGQLLAALLQLRLAVHADVEGRFALRRDVSRQRHALPLDLGRGRNLFGLVRPCFSRLRLRFGRTHLRNMDLRFRGSLHGSTDFGRLVFLSIFFFRVNIIVILFSLFHFLLFPGFMYAD
jgi:hypothetical protein